MKAAEEKAEKFAWIASKIKQCNMDHQLDDKRYLFRDHGTSTSVPFQNTHFIKKNSKLRAQIIEE